MARMLGVLAAAAMAAAPANAYLYWTNPPLKGEPIVGDEPGIALPLPGATPKEVQANLLWTFRAGLNVAALQCQFAPLLRTVANYNGLIKQHSAELNGAMTTLGAYFKRTSPKDWQTKFDQYTTRTYNGFSTMYAQLSFCETAAIIGREALAQRMGQLSGIATTRMRDFRNSLVPIGDASFAFSSAPLSEAATFGEWTEPPPVCTDRKGRVKKCKPAKT